MTNHSEAEKRDIKIGTKAKVVRCNVHDCPWVNQIGTVTECVDGLVEMEFEDGERGHHFYSEIEILTAPEVEKPNEIRVYCTASERDKGVVILSGDEYLRLISRTNAALASSPSVEPLIEALETIIDAGQRMLDWYLSDHIRSNHINIVRLMNSLAASRAAIRAYREKP